MVKTSVQEVVDLDLQSTQNKGHQRPLDLVFRKVSDYLGYLEVRVVLCSPYERAIELCIRSLTILNLPDPGREIFGSTGPFAYATSLSLPDPRAHRVQ